MLALSHRGSVELSPPGGGTIRPLEEIRWVNEHTIETVYVVEDVPQRGLFSFKSDDLESQLKNGLWEKETTISVLEEGEAKQRVSLKTFLFTELGWKAYDELKEKIENNYVLVAEFDNGRIATCKSEGLTVAIPEGAESIRKVGVFSREGDGEFKFWLARAMDKRATKYDIGKGGEVTIMKYCIPDIFESKISQEDIRIEHEGESGEADLVVWTTKKMKIYVELKEGKQVMVKVNLDEKLMIVEATSTKDVDEMVMNPEEFIKKMTEGSGNPLEDLNNHIQLKDYKDAKFGAAAVLAYDPETVYTKGEIPSMIGSYKNPFIKLFLNDDGNLVEVARVVSVEYG